MSQGNTSTEAMSNLFNTLPTDVIIDIISRLPVKEITSCKGVCKSWLHIVESRGFAIFHLSKSAQGLIFYRSDNWSNFYKYLELEDGIVEDHFLHYNLISNFELPVAGWLYGSSDGLLFLCQLTPIDSKPDDLFICNPITREYTMLNSPQEFAYVNHIVAYGFGLSQSTNQYKVVRVCHNRVRDPRTLAWLVTSEVECHVYTLGTGLWRRGPSSGFLEHRDHVSGHFFNGNIHWVVRDSNGYIKISCFDLESESFSTISVPTLRGHGRFDFGGVTLFDSGGCLGLCDNTSPGVVILWLMKEYGLEQSWTMEVVMSKYVLDFGETTSAVFSPIKIFQDGDILLAWKDFFMVYYSSMTRTIQEIEMFKVPPDNMIDVILHTPSFLSLESFGFENVLSF